jgi:hypothetical protein
MAQQSLAEHTAVLVEANGLDLGALRTNRTGALTPAQAERVRGKHRGRGAALLVLGGLGMAFGAWSLWHEPSTSGHSDAWTALVLGAAIVALRWTDFGRSNARQIAAAKVTWVDGPIRIRSLSGDSHTSYYYQIDGHDFPTTEEGAQAIDASLRYRLYHVPGSDVIVNIEPLAQALQAKPPADDAGAAP